VPKPWPRASFRASEKEYSGSFFFRGFVVVVVGFVVFAWVDSLLPAEDEKENSENDSSRDQDEKDMALESPSRDREDCTSNTGGLWKPTAERRESTKGLLLRRKQ
jgi:hypothetical protein